MLSKTDARDLYAGGVGAVAYNAIVAQRPAEAGTVVAFSGGSLLNLSQGKFGRYGVDDVRWLASVGTDYGMIAVRQDAPWKTLKDLLTAMEKDPNSVVIGAGASIGSRDWMKSALLAQKPMSIRTRCAMWLLKAVANRLPH